MRLSPRKLLFTAAMLLGTSMGSAAEGGTDAPAAPAGAPPAAPAGGPAPLPPLAPVTSFDQAGGANGAPPADISSSPPPLSSLGAGVGDAGTTETTGAAVTVTAGPIETYEFLFREDPELGIVRERYTAEEAQQRRNLEAARLQAKYQQPSPAGGQPVPQGADSRGAAEWDFYFEQLQLYSEYVKTKVIRTEDSDFPTPAYDADNALQNADELEREYNETAVRQVNTQWNENQEFYERIQAREDRRRDFLSWLAERDRDLIRWTEIWARRINGANWTDGQPVNRDDWYYGTHFNAAEPVLTNVGGQQFLLSREPQHNVAPTTLNVLSTNLTPYDVVDHYGNVKSPEVERARGTIVRPTPAPIPQAPTGTVELAE